MFLSDTEIMNGRKILILLIALTEWFSLPTQFILHMQNAQANTAEAIMRFFGYFTISTNILVCLWASMLLFTRKGQSSGFFFRPQVQTAITLYIVVVGLVYNTVLRNLWEATPLQAVLHDLLHTVSPLLSLIFWFKYVDTRQLSFKSIPVWLLYPAVYTVITLIRGQFVSWYPYPFFDLAQFGFGQVALNALMLLIVFSGLACVLVWLGLRKSKSVKEV